MFGRLLDGDPQHANAGRMAAGFRNYLVSKDGGDETQDLID